MMMLNGTELKASTVLQAMVTGLKKAKDDPKFRVKMTTFGSVENELCYGCCASLALAEMFGEGRSASELMLGYVKDRLDDSDFAFAYLSDVIPSDPLSTQDSLPIDALENLERAVDKARWGCVSELIELLTGEEYHRSFDDRWTLNDKDWEEQLPEIERTIAEMIKAGY